MGFPGNLGFPWNPGFPGNAGFPRNPGFPGNLGFPTYPGFQGNLRYFGNPGFPVHFKGEFVTGWLRWPELMAVSQMQFASGEV